MNCNRIALSALLAASLTAQADIRTDADDAAGDPPEDSASGLFRDSALAFRASDYNGDYCNGGQ